MVERRRALDSRTMYTRGSCADQVATNLTKFEFTGKQLAHRQFSQKISNYKNEMEKELKTQRIMKQDMKRKIAKLIKTSQSHTCRVNTQQNSYTHSQVNIQNVKTSILNMNTGFIDHSRQPSINSTFIEKTTP